jgi:predicted SprT family Zn-dependent metalloprotease
MELREAGALIRSIMDTHGLWAIPFDFDRGKNRLAATHFLVSTDDCVKITFSKHFAELLSEEEIRNTVLHEIAHAKAGRKAGHGPVWKAHARKLGIPAERCAPATTVAPKGAYQGRCPKGHEHEAHRKPQRVKACFLCSRTFSLDNLITWSQNGRTIPLGAMPVKYQEEMARLQSRQRLATAANNLQDYFRF